MCDGKIEPDLWLALITAGACRRAAKADRRDRAYWIDLADGYSHQAQVLLAWDSQSFARCEGACCKLGP
jgi:hypothetical protein